MPTFNRRGVISIAINSILNQSFKNFELIIVDDGSTDGTEEFILDKYKNQIKSRKIKYYKLEHKGVSKARNFGLKHAEGNMIAYLDSDNQWHSNFLECMLTGLDSNENFNCAYCAVQVYHKVNNTNYVLNDEFNRKNLLIENFIDINSFVHEKELYIKKGGFDERLTRLVDWDLIIRFTENNNPLFINKILVDYFIDKKINNITISEPLAPNMSLIRKKTWRELYSDEYDAIVDFFDQEYYLKNYPDVLKIGMHPLHHFLSLGHKERRNPNKEFMTYHYAKLYPDVIKNGLNPFVHYIKWGQFENREINYYNKRDRIVNNNLIRLSNYTFEHEPLVSIIILNRNGLSHLRVLFEDFCEKTNYSNFEIIVVDNGSTDSSIDFLKSLKDLPIRIIENKENVSFSKGNNDAAKIAKGEYILLLNNDIEPTFGWLNELMGTIIYNDNVGAVGAKLVYPYIYDDKNQYSFTIQHAGDIFREEFKPNCLYNAYNLDKFSQNIFDKSLSFNKKCLLVTGAVYLTKKDIYLELGGLDEDFWYGYEDVDFNLRLYENGYDVVLASSALLFHHESATPRESTVIGYNSDLLCKKWGKFLFKNLLKDKIEKKCFFTEKKLKFLLVSNHNFYNNDSLKTQMVSITNYLTKQDYLTDVNLNLSNLVVYGDVDVLLSFTQEYDIRNITSRKNLIKLLIFNNDELFNENINYDIWDIIITTDESVKNNIISQNAEIPVYYVSDIDELGENIISSLYGTFIE